MANLLNLTECRPLIYPSSEWDGQRVRVCQPDHAAYQAVVIGTIRDGNVYDPRVLVRHLTTAREESVRIIHVALLH